ncbi:UNVERIFIED_CONTAM: hypothetical protein FKN15_060981 [Acipenser sinensis]
MKEELNILIPDQNADPREAGRGMEGYPTARTVLNQALARFLRLAFSLIYRGQTT